MTRIPLITSLSETFLGLVHNSFAKNDQDKNGKSSTRKPLRASECTHYKKPRSMAVIITTYNNPRWLEKVLWGYSAQQFDTVPVKIVLADDGSQEATRDMIAAMRSKLSQELIHVWHPDNGFQKTRILNRAIVAADADYLIFTDHDCIPRNDFLATHYQYAEPNYFLSGGYVKLPMNISELLTPKDITSGRAFRVDWLRSQGVSLRQNVLKLTANKTLATILNWLTPTAATWNGHGSSCWTTDALAINGYNEQMRYGGLDREFGERLLNFGVKAKQVRHSVPVLHLDHSRPYVIPEAIEKNKAWRAEVRRSKKILSPLGITEMLAEKNDNG